MRFEVSKTDYQILVSVLNLLKQGGRECAITRTDILRESGVSSCMMTKKLHNLHMKEKQLKENIS